MAMASISPAMMGGDGKSENHAKMKLPKIAPTAMVEIRARFDD